MKNKVLPSKHEQLTFLERYGVKGFDNFEDVFVQRIYERVLRAVPLWIDWCIRISGKKKFFHEVMSRLGIIIDSDLEGDDYYIFIRSINDRGGYILYCGGIYVNNNQWHEYYLNKIS